MFSFAEVEAFARTSQDFNPIHASEGFAGAYFPDAVVFGALVFLKMVRYASVSRPTQVRATFVAPVYPQRLYTLLAATSGSAEVLRLQEGTRILAEVRVDSGVPVEKENPALDSASPAEGLERADDKTYELVESELSALRLQLSLGRFAHLLQPLMWISYLSGTQVCDGASMLLAADIEFLGEHEHASRFTYRIQNSLPTKRGIILSQSELCAVGKIICRVAFRTVSERRSKPYTEAEWLQLIGGLPKLKAKTALVLGGTRGLGGCLSRMLHAKHIQTIATYLRSDADAELLLRYFQEHDATRSFVLKGDAGDASWCRRLAEFTGKELGGLDYLFLSATPVIEPVSFSSESAASQIGEFLQRSISTVTAPLATLAEQLETSHTTIVFISSTLAGQARGLWGHYRAAKMAGESLLEAFVLEQITTRGVIIRCPKFLSRQTSFSPGNRLLLRAEDVAAGILDSLTRLPAITERIFTMNLCRPGKDAEQRALSINAAQQMRSLPKRASAT